MLTDLLEALLQLKRPDRPTTYSGRDAAEKEWWDETKGEFVREQVPATRFPVHEMTSVRDMVHEVSEVSRREGGPHPADIWVSERGVVAALDVVMASPTEKDSWLQPIYHVPLNDSLTHESVARRMAGNSYSQEELSKLLHGRLHGVFPADFPDKVKTHVVKTTSNSGGASGSGIEKGLEEFVRQTVASDPLPDSVSLTYQRWMEAEVTTTLDVRLYVDLSDTKPEYRFDLPVARIDRARIEEMVALCSWVRNLVKANDFDTTCIVHKSNWPKELDKHLKAAL